MGIVSGASSLCSHTCILRSNTRYCSTTGHDSQNSWTDYAANPCDAQTQRPFRSFPRWYIKQSRRHVLTLDGEEDSTGGVITTFSTMENVWKYLTTRARKTMMRAKRISDPQHVQMWDLSWRKGQDRQPAHQIMKVYLLRDVTLSYLC